MARPTRRENDRREQEFLGLVARGMSLSQACRSVRLNPYRALDLATSPEFWAQVADSVRSLPDEIELVLQ